MGHERRARIVACSCAQAHAHAHPELVRVRAAQGALQGTQSGQPCLCKELAGVMQVRPVPTSEPMAGKWACPREPAGPPLVLLITQPSPPS